MKNVLNTVDFDIHEVPPYPIFTLHQADTAVIRLALTSYAKDITVTGQEASVCVEKANKGVVLLTDPNNIVCYGNYVDIYTVPAMLDCPGIAHFELRLKDASGAMIAADFDVNIIAAIGSKKDLITDDYVDSVERWILYLKELLNEGGESSALGVKVAEHETRLDRLEPDINQHETRLDRLEPRVAKNEGDIANTNTKVDRDAKYLNDLYINVKEFHAGGADWGLTINKAINEAVRKGKKIYIPSGNYNISTTINLKEGASLIGEAISNNWSSTGVGVNLNYTGNSQCINISNIADTTSNVFVENVYIINKTTNDVGIGLNIGTNGEHDDYLTHTSDIFVKNVVIKGFKNGLSINRAFGLKIENVKTIDCKIGWNFTDQDGYSMTYSSFNNVGSYSSEKAFVFNRFISESTSFNNVFVDNADVGIEITKKLGGSTFQNVGLEAIKKHGVYIKGDDITVGFSSLSMSINSDKTQLKDFILYDSDGILYLNKINISSMHTPNNGYSHVNIVSGHAVLDNCHISSLKGLYYGNYTAYGSLLFNKKQGKKISKVEKAETATNYLDVRSLESIVFVRTTGRKVDGSIPPTVLSNGVQGQTIKLIGYDDANKFLIDSYYYPKIDDRYFLGKNDFIELIYEDIDGTGLNWWILDKSNDRKMNSHPTSGFWEQGTYVRNLRPQADGILGWVCTTRGESGTWKEVKIN